MRKYGLLFLLVFGWGVSFADVRLPAVLASNMVLQQRTDAKLWGWCDPGERIYVTTSWNQRIDSAKGTRDGKWMLSVPTPAAGGPYTIEIRGYNRILLENILIGEVWVCSGQSNMEMSETWGLPDVRAELPSCYNTNIRFFHVPRTTSPYQQEDVKADWVVCDSTALKRFSAVGYFFGKRLNKELNVPVGLVESAWSGSPAEVWSPGDVVEQDTLLHNAAVRQVPRDGWPYTPGYCYNAMLMPLASFPVAGAIWYQGESNTVAPQTYSRLLTTMIASWRKAWGRPLSFYYVQIAPFKYEIKDQASVLREQQEKVMSVENTGMVVVSDLVDDTADIHPKDKHDVGYRLANWALGDTYHRTGVVYRHPT
ncbi:MAG: sialate O-acetylesterase, partial [Bacteroidetes bacterium]|nr:sialate O-acetylesterase [Bacteroidota bacterium]